MYEMIEKNMQTRKLTFNGFFLTKELIIVNKPTFKT